MNGLVLQMALSSLILAIRSTSPNLEVGALHYVVALVFALVANLAWTNKR